MRTWMFGLTVVAALTMSASETAAQGCDRHAAPQAQATHQHDGGRAMSCGGTQAAPLPPPPGNPRQGHGVLQRPRG